MRIDLTGQKFNRLTVLKLYKVKKNYTYWSCKCDCGTEKVVRGDHLKSDLIKSCGCLRSKNFYRHGLSVSNDKRIYNIWRAMIRRCYVEKDTNFHHYGGRGIIVCEEWRNDAKVFISWAKDNGYEHNLTIDRRNNDEGYTPDNCHWTTVKEQNRNMTTTVFTPETVILARQLHSEGISGKEIAKRLGVKKGALQSVLSMKNWKDISQPEVDSEDNT